MLAQNDHKRLRHFIAQDPYLKPYLSAKIAALMTLKKEQEKVDREVTGSVRGFFEKAEAKPPSSLGAMKKFKGESADELAERLREMISNPGLLENILADQTQQRTLPTQPRWVKAPCQPPMSPGETCSGLRGPTV